MKNELEGQMDMYFDFDDYQLKAYKTLTKGNLGHLSAGLAAETGEVMGIIQKFHRGDKRYVLNPDEVIPVPSEDMRMSLMKEMGDTLWYLACLADYFDIPLSAIARSNISKLEKRQKEGVIQGDGDNR